MIQRTNVMTVVILPCSDLHCRKISLVEHNQSNYTQNQACNNQYPGIPPGQVMIDQRVNGWGVVERTDLEHPLELVGEAAKGVDQIAKHNDAYRCSPSCAAGIDEGAAEHA